MPKIVIQTDGTDENFKLSIDGKEVSNLNDVYLSGYFDNPGSHCSNIAFSYSTKEKDKNSAMTKVTSYRLDPARASLVEEAGKPRPVREDFRNM